LAGEQYELDPFSLSVRETIVPVLEAVLAIAAAEQMEGGKKGDTKKIIPTASHGHLLNDAN